MCCYLSPYQSFACPKLLSRKAVYVAFWALFDNRANLASLYIQQNLEDLQFVYEGVGFSTAKICEGLQRKINNLAVEVQTAFLDRTSGCGALQHVPNGVLLQTQFLCDRAQAFAAEMKLEHLLGVNDESGASAMHAAALGGLHAGLYTFDDHGAFKLGDRRKNGHQEFASWVVIVCVDSLTGANKSHSPSVETLDGLNKIGDRSPEPIKFPNEDDVKFVQSGGRHQLIELRA